MQVVKTRDPEYGYPSLKSTVELATESKCSYLEILHYRAVSSHETRVEHKTGSLNDDSLLTWLTNVCPLPSLFGERRLRGIPGYCQISRRERDVYEGVYSYGRTSSSVSRGQI